MNEYVLAHYGIPDMHWGIRRYQNKDGSLTPAGKKRYQKSDGKTKNGNQKSEEQIKSEKQKRIDSKNRGVLTDAELKAKVDRLRLEKDLKDLTDEQISPGKKFVNYVLSESGKKVAVAALTGGGLYMVYHLTSGDSINRKDLGLSMAKGQFSLTEKKKS